MNKQDILDIILCEKIIAIIRLDTAQNVSSVAEALYRGGIKAIEVTMGTPNVLDEIKKLARHPGILPGAGSVLSAEMARSAIESGAEFIVTPTSKKEIIDAAHDLGKPIFSGALTPGEIHQAYDWEADVIKLFPAANFGISYLKAVKAPLPHIPIMPTGGININNATAWLEAGAVCLGVGSSLVNRQLIESSNFEEITRRARALKDVVSNYQN